jgi:hypothetical protein
MSDKWIYSSNNEEAWRNISEEYDTREDAIRDGKETAKEEGWFNLFIARAVPIYPNITVDAQEIIDYAANVLGEQDSCDSDAGQRFLDSISQESIVLLQQMLDKTIEEWQEKINYHLPIILYSCEDVELISLEKGEAE